MKKFIFLTLAGFVASAAVWTVRASDVSMRGIGFYAPEVKLAEDIPNPEIGAIVLENNSGTKAFKGFDGVDWTAFSAPVGGFVPVGTVLPFAGDTPPPGYKMANGDSLSRTEYAALFEVIGTTYGSIDGNSFNLPNLQGVFVRGTGSQTIGTVTYSGGALGAKQGDLMQGHKHNDSGHFHNIGGSNTNTTGSGFAKQAVIDNANVTSVSYANIGGPVDNGQGAPRVGSETRPANISLSYIIKY